MHTLLQKHSHIHGGKVPSHTCLGISYYSYTSLLFEPSFEIMVAVEGPSPLRNALICIQFLLGSETHWHPSLRAQLQGPYWQSQQAFQKHPMSRRLHPPPSCARGRRDGGGDRGCVRDDRQGPDLWTEATVLWTGN